MIRLFLRSGPIVGAIGFLAAATSFAQAPSVATGGVVNAASFSKNPDGTGAAVAPGALVAIFGNFPGASFAVADSVPLSTNMGNVQVTINNVNAPLDLVSPTGAFPFITAQVPYEALSTGQNTAVVNVVVSVNGVASAPEQTTLLLQAPGIFTIPPTGQGNAVLVFTDPADGVVKIAGPPSLSASINFPIAAIPRGTNAFFYATGLGAMTPPLNDGYGGLEPPAVNHQNNVYPVVLVGGMTAQVGFAGQAPGYPGVSQVNITIPQNAPTGDAVSFQIMTADGSITTTSAVTIAVR